VHQKKSVIGVAIGLSLATLAVCAVLTVMLPIIPLELVWGVGVAAMAIFCFAIKQHLFCKFQSNPHFLNQRQP
jgi:hypothetical protein